MRTLTSRFPLGINLKAFGYEEERLSISFSGFSKRSMQFPIESHLCCNPFSDLIALQAETGLYFFSKASNFDV